MYRVAALTICILCFSIQKSFAGLEEDEMQCASGSLTMVLTACWQVIGTPGLTNDRLALALSYRGIANFKIGEIGKANADIKRTEELAPDDPVVINNIGTAYRYFAMDRLFGKRKSWAEHNLKKSLEYINRAIRLDPNYAEAYRNRGATYGFLRKKQATKRDYLRAFELGSRYPHLLAGLRKLDPGKDEIRRSRIVSEEKKSCA